MASSGLGGAPTPLHVTSTPAIPQQQQQTAHTVTLHQSVQPTTPASPFPVLSKSPGAALPRTSPSPSPYHATTPSPHPSVQSPAPYTTRSPAPSPHTVGSMRSPAPPTPSPAATPTPQTHSSIAGLPQQPSGMVMGNVGMMQSLVPQLPLSQVVGSNGMVLPQPGVPPSAPGVKQVVSGGQLIQIVSSPQPTQPRQPLTTPAHKPIQPKQPQLLPKPPQATVVGQPAPAPPGKTLLGTRPVTPGGQQPIVIGAGQQPTMMPGQQGLGGFVINPSVLQSGLQQPLLIQQPNGVLLVRPSGPSGAGGAPGQALLVPMPGQPPMIGAGAKAGQPQTVVFPSNGQGGPAYVIPQNGAPSGLGAPGVMGAAQGARGPQPIIRLVAPQAPLQLQHIQTPNGPTLVAVAAGQTVNLQGLLTTGGATVRTLAPQVASGPLQLAPNSVAPPPVVSMGHIQIPGGGQQVQVSVPGAPLQLATSLPSPLPSVITTTKQTVIDDAVAAPPASMVTASEAPAHHHTITDANKTTKKKSKKKKREKDPKDDKLKGKGTSINLNDILKETGISGDLMLFDEPELGGLGGDGIDGGVMNSGPAQPAHTVTQTTPTPAPPVHPTPPTPDTATVTFSGGGEGGGHIVIGSSQPHPLVGGTMVTSAAPPGLITTTNMAGGMSFTLDPSGKFILGSDPTKATITTSAPPHSQIGSVVVGGSQAQGVQVVGGVSSTLPTPSLVTLASTPASSSMPTILPAAPGSTPGLPVGSLPSFTQLLTTPTQATHNPAVPGSKTKSLQLQSVSKLTQVTGKSGTGVDISRVAQNTHLLQTLHLPTPDKLPPGVSGGAGPPLVTSLVPGPQSAPSTATVASGSGGEGVGVGVQVSVTEGGPVLTLVSVGGVVSLAENATSTFSSPQAPLSILVPSQASQVPPSSAVIVSSSATNSVVSGAIISHKQFVSTSALIPHTSVTYTNTDNVPISRCHSQIISSLQDNVPSQTNHTSSFLAKSSETHKTQTFQNEYVATVQRGQSIIDPNKNKSKSNKKKKKDKESDTAITVTSGSVGAKQSLHERLKSGTGTITSGTIQQQLPLAPIPNGLNTPAIKSTSHNLAASGPVVSMVPGDAGGHCDTSTLTGPNISVAPSATTVTITTTSTTTTTTVTTTAPQAPTATTTIITTTTAATSTSPHVTSGMVIPVNKQQFKQVKLILSPQNQEALKKVHSQIQALQTRKGGNEGQDEASLQQLYHEYRRIMATGKHVAVTPTHHPPQISPAPSQPTAVRYSHPVGHKIITLTHIKQQLKHLPQEQQRQIIDQNKVVQRWKDTSITASSPLTSPPATHAPTPHLSPTTQTSVCVSSKGSVSPGASMPTIATSVPSPTLPTTTTTSTSTSVCTGTTSTPKMTPPAPLPPTTPLSTPTALPQPVSHLGSLGSSPKAVVLQPQTSPHPTVAPSPQDQSPGAQVKTPPTTYSITKEQLFEHQLKTDQNGALNPDYRTPFKNKIDACKRLIRYHVFNEPPPTPRELAESNAQLELQAESLLKKFSNMKYKYQSLLVKESMRRHPSSETVMLYRLFLQEDKTNLEKEKSDIQSGKTIELPRLPPSRPVPPAALTPETIYPWELEWESQKIYKFEPWRKGAGRLKVKEEGIDKEWEEREEEEEEEAEKEEGQDNVREGSGIQEEDGKEGNKNSKVEVKKEEGDAEEEELVVEEEEGKCMMKEEKEDQSTREKDEVEETDGSGIGNLKMLNEDELPEFEDSQEGETRLHIHMAEEEDEEVAEEERVQKEEKCNETEKTQEDSSVPRLNCCTTKSEIEVAEENQQSPQVGKLNYSNKRRTDTDSLDMQEEEEEEKKESEQEEEELVICDTEATSTSQHNSPAGGDTVAVENANKCTENCNEDVVSRPPKSPSPEVFRVPGNVPKPLVYPPIVHGPPLLYSPLKLVSERTEKEKKKERTEKERRKSDRTKVKERGRDREKEDRPPKKLKIKLKSEERALVPPLRIRTEDRGMGLKLTLKKQEGSGAYYSVGEERTREYRVEQNKEEEDDDEDVDDRVLGSFNNEEEEEEEEEKEEGDEEGHNSLKEVKVVLQDVLKDKRFKKQTEEKGGKKRRRERSDERSDKNDRYSSNSHWLGYPQPYSQGEQEKHFTSQPANHDSRNWNYNNSVEWRRGGEEGASGADTTSSQKTREYSSHLYGYGESYGHEYSGRHNHSQNYGHSGSQQRNSHTYY